MHVAVLGATGAVGRTMLQVLEERRLDIDRLTVLASERSAGMTLRWKGRELTVEAPKPGTFRGVDVADCAAWGFERTAPRSGARAPPTRAPW